MYHGVKSACSVNATAGRPTPTARWQVPSMDQGEGVPRPLAV